jgi:hypothetical protein
MNQTVAKPDRFKHAGLFRHDRRLDQRLDIGESEQRAAIG